MYMSAGALTTAAAAPQPKLEPAHEAEPYVMGFDCTLDVKPEEMPAPSRGAKGHEAHTAAEVAPTVDEKVPAGHVAVHVWEVSPGVDPYVPTGQGVHAVALPAEKVPAGQDAEHAAVASPVVLPYTPAGQGVHAGVAAPPTE